MACAACYGDGMGDRSTVRSRSAVLIADDQLALRIMLATAIEVAGYVALSAADGAEALELARTNEIGVILLDLRMPGLSGEAFCEQYRAGGGQAPIVIMTGSSVSTVDEVIVRCRPDAVLKKPFSLQELLPLVERLLEGGCDLHGPEPTRP